MRFCGDPLKGLDSNTGREIITRILDASKKRQLATVMTINQPSYQVSLQCDRAKYNSKVIVQKQILQQFDRLLLLSKGRICYFGPTLDAIQYFEDLDFEIVGNPAETYGIFNPLLAR
jgi:ATP-binding cassette subfamily G (WHITE) protein 1